MVFAVGRTLSLGRAVGLITVIANAAGTSIWILVSAFGLNALIQAFPGLLSFIQWLGIAYLAYLGLKSILTSKRISSESQQFGEDRQPLSKVFAEGFVVGITNPKVAVFFTAILPQFINPSGSFLIQFLLLGLIFEVLGVIGDSVWVIGAATFREWILTKPSRMRAISIIGGVLIVLVSIWLILELM
ncbi:MAG: hypothetical protein RLZZ579_906 [Actinomycetota bacterium]